MSGNAFGSAILGAKMSQLSRAITGDKSLFAQNGWMASTPTFRDDYVKLLPANGIVTPPINGSTLSFNLPKNSTLIGRCWIEITLSAGTDNANPGPASFNPDVAYNAATNFPVAEYNKNVGDTIIDNHRVIYGNTNLQYFQGVFGAVWRRVCCNDVNIEATNAMVLGALRPGGDVNTGSERILVDAFYRGVTLYVPLEELYWVNNRSEYHMTEAYALEHQLLSQLVANLGQIVSTRTRTSSEIATAPTITNVALRYSEITLSAAEKENRLKLYKTPEGCVQHFLDLEFMTALQIQGTGTRAAYNAGTPSTWLENQPNLRTTFQLSNFRMDMAELIIMINRVSNSSGAATFPLENGKVQATGYAGNVMESDPTPSILYANSGVSTLQGFSTMIPATSITLIANAKQIFATPQTDFWNRSAVRKSYHPDSQIADPIYVLPLAEFPQDRKNATGHLSASVIGNLQLQVDLPNPGSTIAYQVTVWSHSHNLMQSRLGGIAKALN